LQATILAALEDQKEDRRQARAIDDWRPGWPNPAKWISEKRWEDQVVNDQSRDPTPSYFDRMVKRGAELGVYWEDFGSDSPGFLKAVKQHEQLEELYASAI